jgi:hypothetical protein
LFVGEGNKHTKQTDIFAFGVVCFEISARKEPWSHLKGNQPVLYGALLNGRKCQNVKTLKKTIITITS